MGDTQLLDRTSVTHGHRKGGGARWWPVVPAVVALAVTAWRFDAKPLWRDETWTLATATRPWGAMIAHLAVDDAGLGFYYAVMHVWLLAGEATWWLRLPSLLAAVAAAVLAGLIAARFAGPVAGAAAGSALAVMPVMVEHSQEARPYPLVVAATCAAVWTLLRWLEQPTTGLWAVWTVAAFVAAALHPMVGLPAVLAVGGAALLVAGRGRWRGIATGMVAPTLVGAAVVAIGSQQAWRAGGPVAADVLRLRHNYGAGTIAVALLVVLAAAGAWWLLRRDRPALVMMGAWAAVPPVVLLGYGAAAGHYQPRYMAAAAPPVAVLAGVGCAALVAVVAARTSRTISVVAAALLVVAVVAVQLSYLVPFRQSAVYGDDPRAAAAVVAAGAQPGDSIIYVGSVARPMITTYLPAGAPVRDVLLIAPAPAGTDLGGVELADPDAVTALAPAGRVWLIGLLDGDTWAPRPRSSTVLDAATQTRTRVSSGDYGRTRVELWAPTG